MDISLRAPRAEDGAKVATLIKCCPPLDNNSVYCNLLQCTHFAATSVAAESEAALVGFISAYVIPGRPDTVFVWQVAVDASARGQGLARRMIEALLARPACADVRFLETTITESNKSSWALFEAVARAKGAALSSELLFDSQRHFDGEHDSELLVRIGPFVQ